MKQRLLALPVLTVILLGTFDISDAAGQTPASSGAGNTSPYVWLRSIRWSTTTSRFYLDIGSDNLIAPVTYGFASALLQISQLIWQTMTITAIVVASVMSKTTSILPLLVNSVSDVLFQVALGPIGLLVAIGLGVTAWRNGNNGAPMAGRLLSVLVAAGAIIAVGQATNDAQIVRNAGYSASVPDAVYDYPALSAGGLTEGLLNLRDRFVITSAISLSTPSVELSGAHKSSCINYEVYLQQKFRNSDLSETVKADMLVYDALYEAAYLDVAAAAAFGAGESADHIRCVAWERSGGATEAGLIEEFKVAGMLPSDAQAGVLAWRNSDSYNRSMAWMASCNWNPGQGWTVRDGWEKAWWGPEDSAAEPPEDGVITPAGCAEAARSGDNRHCGESRVVDEALEGAASSPIGGILDVVNLDTGTCNTDGHRNGPWHWSTLGEIENRNTQAPEVRETMYAVTGNAASTAIGVAFFSLAIGLWSMLAIGLSQLAAMIALTGLAFSVPLVVVPLMRIAMGAENGANQLRQWAMGVLNLMLVSVLVNFAPVIWAQVAVQSMSAADAVTSSVDSGVVGYFHPIFGLAVTFFFLAVFTVALIWTALRARKMGAGGSIVAKALNPVGAVKAASSASFAAAATPVDGNADRRGGRLNKQLMFSAATQLAAQGGFASKAAGMVLGTNRAKGSAIGGLASEAASRFGRRSGDSSMPEASTGRGSRRDMDASIGRKEKKASSKKSTKTSIAELDRVRALKGDAAKRAEAIKNRGKRLSDASQVLRDPKKANSREAAEARALALKAKKDSFRDIAAKEGLTEGTNEYREAKKAHLESVDSEWESLQGDPAMQGQWARSVLEDGLEDVEQDTEEVQREMSDLNARGVGLRLHGQEYLEVETELRSATEEYDAQETSILRADLPPEEERVARVELQRLADRRSGLQEAVDRMEDRNQNTADSQVDTSVGSIDRGRSSYVHGADDIAPADSPLDLIGAMPPPPAKRARATTQPPAPPEAIAPPLSQHATQADVRPPAGPPQAQRPPQAPPAVQSQPPQQQQQQQQQQQTAQPPRRERTARPEPPVAPIQAPSVQERPRRRRPASEAPTNEMPLPPNGNPFENHRPAPAPDNEPTAEMPTRDLPDDTGKKET